MQLKALDSKIEDALEDKDQLDPYSLAHLGEAKVRIDKALDAQFIYNVNDLGGGSSLPFIILGEGQEKPAGQQ